MLSQYLSLGIGIFMCIMNINYYRKNFQNGWTLIFWLLIWGSYVAFYVFALFISEGGQMAHTVSSYVRLARNSLLAGWFIFHFWGKTHGN